MRFNVSARFNETVYCRIQGIKINRNKYGHESDILFCAHFLKKWLWALTHTQNEKPKMKSTFRKNIRYTTNATIKSPILSLIQMIVFITSKRSPPQLTQGQSPTGWEIMTTSFLHLVFFGFRVEMQSVTSFLILNKFH